MKKTVILTLALMLLTVFCTGCAKNENNSDETTEGNADMAETTVNFETSEVTDDTPVIPAKTINSIRDLNKTGEMGDHSSESMLGVSVEMNYRENQVLWKDELGTPNNQYPRIKKLPNGQYILFYQDGQHGPQIYYCLGDEDLNFGPPNVLFEKEKIPEGFTRIFATCDAVVLQNGDILAFASYRTSTGYSTYIQFNGIIMRRSSDNGNTWSEEQIVYVGTNWEPYATQLKSGEVQVYFTQTAPMIYKYGFNDERRSSGVGLIRSFDNGVTWTPDVQGAPYAAQQVMQQYVLDLDGVKHMTDQMPSAVELQNGTIAMVTESYMKDKKYKISLGISDDNWAKWLAEDEKGPEYRRDNMFSGAAPYIGQFYSGETMVSYNTGTKMYLKIGNSTAKNFSTGYVIYKEPGFWGSFEIDSTHSAIVVWPEVNTPSKTGKLHVGRTYLNHALHAKKLSVTVDGMNTEWADNTDAFFIGSESQAQVSVRCAYDDNNIYFLAERLDEYLEDGDKLKIYIDSPESTEMYIVTLGFNGIEKIEHTVSKTTTEADIPGAECKVYIEGSVNDASGEKDLGCVYELSIPKSCFGIEDNSFSFNCELYNTDNGVASAKDCFMHVTGAPSKKLWPVIYLK